MSYPEKTKDGPTLEALVPGRFPKEMTEKERDEAIEIGASFAQAIAHDSPGPCLVITGEFVPPDYPVPTVDSQVMECCLDAFDYKQDGATGPSVNILLDSTGGSLDSDFKTVRYLTWYFDRLNVYVPRQAKSASTLLALGSHLTYLSPFGELGPLDTQIPDPRNPTTFVSALDCYQSVDYVRKFGVETMSQALSRLGEDARSQIALVDLLDAARSFGADAIQPMLKGIRALDFGAWGRSLQIGEKYARQILEHNEDVRNETTSTMASNVTSPVARRANHAIEIAYRLVYEYPHHLYFMDYREVRDIGIQTDVMPKSAYEEAMRLLKKTEGRSFVDFVGGEQEIKKRRDARKTRSTQALQRQVVRSPMAGGEGDVRGRAEDSI